MTDDQAYLGTQDQGSTAADYNAKDYHIRQVIEQTVRTGQPVRIVRPPYDARGNTITPGTAAPIGFVDVQPLVNQLDGYGQATPHGTVYRLSYYRYQNGIFAIYADPVMGDIGHMVVADRDTSSVKATGKQANPGSRRKFDMADGTYFGSTQGGAPLSYIIPQPDGSISLVVPADKKLAITGDLTVTGSITAGFGGMDQVTLQHHTHKDVTPGSGHSGQPDPGT